MRPENPNSFIDVAVSLIRENKPSSYSEAVKALLKVIEGKWDVRFDQIELTALLELARCLKKMKQNNLFVLASNLIPPSLVEWDLLKEIDDDIRIILNWDTDLSNVELEVIEPNGQVANPFHNLTSNGGMLSKDFTGGYGPIG